MFSVKPVACHSTKRYFCLFFSFVRYFHIVNHLILRTDSTILIQCCNVPFVAVSPPFCIVLKIQLQHQTNDKSAKRQQCKKKLCFLFFQQIHIHMIMMEHLDERLLFSLPALMLTSFTLKQDERKNCRWISIHGVAKFLILRLFFFFVFCSRTIPHSCVQFQFLLHNARDIQRKFHWNRNDIVCFQSADEDGKESNETIFSLNQIFRKIYLHKMMKCRRFFVAHMEKSNGTFVRQRCVYLLLECVILDGMIRLSC